MRKTPSSLVLLRLSLVCLAVATVFTGLVPQRTDAATPLSLFGWVADSVIRQGAAPQGQIVFRAYAGYYAGNIGIVNEDGTQFRMLTDWPGHEGGAMLSPDGNEVMFAYEPSAPGGSFDLWSVPSIHVGPVPIGEAQRVTSTGRDDAGCWSPCGRFMAYTARPHGPCEIWLRDLVTGEEHPVSVPPAGYDDWGPDWSVTGEIAFTREVTTSDWRTRGRSDDIYVTNPDGTGERRITDNYPLGDRYPRWSPAGDRLCVGRGEIDVRESVVVMDADGTAERELQPGQNAYYPDWSPDGKQIACAWTPAPHVWWQHIRIADVQTGATVRTLGPYDDVANLCWGIAPGGAPPVPPTYIIAGTVYEDTDGSGSPDAAEGMPGATVTAQPGGRTSASGQDGFYVIAGLPAGSYTVTPTKDAWRFEPTAETVGVPPTVAQLDFRGYQNRPPLADAGPDQTVEANTTGGANVTLDGSRSSDPDGDPLTYLWTWRDDDGSHEASGAAPTVLLPLGDTVVTLVVNDGTASSDPDEVAIHVRDTAPPTLADLAADPAVLWPPNHRMRSVAISYEASDIADSEPAVEIAAVTCNEGSFDPSDYEMVDAHHVTLRAEREGTSRDGRVYTITLTAADACSNEATYTTTVTVPHDMRDRGGQITSASAIATPAGAQVTFSLSADTAVTATVLNIAGRPIRRLCVGKACEAGTSTLLWNAQADSGLRVPNGTYLISLTASAPDGQKSRALATLRLNR